MQQSDYEIVGKFGFESRTHRQLQSKIRKSSDSQRDWSFFIFGQTCYKGSRFLYALNRLGILG